MKQRMAVALIATGWAGILLVFGWHLIRAAAATVAFYDSGQTLGNDVTVGLELGDLDGDNDLDLFTVSSGGTSFSRVWLNQNGFFSSSGQSLPSANNLGVALGDLNGDAHLDAFITVGGLSPANQIWLNDGSGLFTDSGQRLGSQVSEGVALGDLDGDGDLDAFLANRGENRVFIQVSGGLTDTLQSLGTSQSFDVALGDLDGDGDLDGFVGNGGTGGAPDRVWLNNGSGVYTDTGQTLGFEWTYGVALGDLDGDSDLDAVTAHFARGGGGVYLNTGPAVFTATGQTLGSTSALGVELADVDKDGDLDVVLATSNPNPTEIWLNQGDGSFILGPTIANGLMTFDVVIGDIDGDLDLDVIAGNFGPDQVWFNGIPGLPNARLDVERENNSGGLESAFWTGSGDAQLNLRLSQPAGAPVEVKTRIESSGGVVTKTTTFLPGQQNGGVTLANPGPNPEETVRLLVLVGFAGATPAEFVQTDSLNLVFVDNGQAVTGCILCYAEWLLRFIGFNPTFGALHHVDYGSRPNSPQWAYYSSLFANHSPEMAMIVATHPMILVDGYNTLELWTPALQSFDGSGNGVVTQEMVDKVTGVLDRIEANADPELAALIAHEQTTLDLDSWAGLTVSQSWDNLAAKKQPATLFLPVIAR